MINVQQKHNSPSQSLTFSQGLSEFYERRILRGIGHWMRVAEWLSHSAVVQEVPGSNDLNPVDYEVWGVPATRLP